tara:strand:+ start:1353 stop:2276 length:924 start_codon:yes stop_codon:yes gene_type:complete
MNYQELVSLVGGSNPQDATYQDIVSGIQSQYRPQTQFAPTTSLLDMIGSQLPDQPRIAYGSLLQAQPRVLPTPMKAITPDGMASVDSGDINLGADTANTGLNLSGTLVYNNDFSNTGAYTGNVAGDTTNKGLFGTNVTGTDIAKVGGVVAPIAALAGNSDLVKTAVALNLIGSAADIKTEQDVVNLGTKIAMLAAGPSGNALAAGLGLATNNTPLTANALLSLANPTLGLINSIVSNLTGNSFGNVVSGLLTAPEGSISDLGLLGASDYGNAIDRSYADVNDVLRDSFSGGGGGSIKDYWNRAINAE